MTEREKQIGLTFTQLISMIGIIALIFGAWISINVKMAETSTRVSILEEGMKENSRYIQQMYQDNRNDNKEVMKKIDNLIYDLSLSKGNNSKQ